MRSLLLLVLVAQCVFGKPLIERFNYPPYYGGDDNDNPTPGETHEIPAGSCGVNKYNPTGLVVPQPFIVGGKATIPNAYPWQVSLRAYGSHMCGGTIVSEWYILTAAHCFGTYSSPSAWEVAAGKHYLSSSEASEKTYKVAKVIRHENYDSYSNANDVTLLKLATKIEFTDSIQPICLPSSTLGTLEGAMATVTGWGATREGGSAPNALQEVSVPVISNSKCQDSYPQETINDGMICAGYDAGGKDSCQGDSGGPFVLQIDGKWTSVGIVSWGYGCARAGQPGVYTRTSKFLPWIQSKLV